jgi:hypothetical protein
MRCKQGREWCAAHPSELFCAERSATGCPLGPLQAAPIW